MKVHNTLGNGFQEVIYQRCLAIELGKAGLEFEREKEQTISTRSSILKIPKFWFILVYFLEKHASEVLNMLFTEWNLDDALAVRYEEGTEDGIEIGREERLNEILDLMKKGYTSTDIENHFRR